MYLPKLVICEKLSVAKSIAGVIGRFVRQNGYWDCGEYLVSWCVGHLVELVPPSAYDAIYAKRRS